MIKTADAWIDSNGRATIDLFADTLWTSGDWELFANSGYPDSGYTGLYNLYRQQGTGVTQQYNLRVTIDACPNGNFTLETNQGSKIFNLSDGEIVSVDSLVGLNDTYIFTYEAQGKTINDRLSGFRSLIYFGDKKSPFKGRLTGQLQKDGELHCLVAGNAVDLVQNIVQQNFRWAPPAAIFYQFYWIQEPTEATSYNFVFRDERRDGSGQIMSFPVVMSNDEIISPSTNSIFDPDSTHSFQIALSQGDFI